MCNGRVVRNYFAVYRSSLRFEIAFETQKSFLEELITQRRNGEGDSGEYDNVCALAKRQFSYCARAPRDFGKYVNVPYPQNRDVEYIDPVTVDANRGGETGSGESRGVIATYQIASTTFA